MSREHAIARKDYHAGRNPSYSSLVISCTSKLSLGRPVISLASASTRTALSPTVTALAVASPLRQALKKYSKPGGMLADSDIDDPKLILDYLRL
jgi:hypothetical protein